MQVTVQEIGQSRRQEEPYLGRVNNYEKLLKKLVRWVSHGVAPATQVGLKP